MGCCGLFLRVVLGSWVSCALVSCQPRSRTPIGSSHAVASSSSVTVHGPTTPGTRDLDGSAPTTASAEPARPRPQAFVSLDVPRHEPAVVSLPSGFETPKPVLVAVHGAGDTPEWQCRVWRAIVRARGFVLCPRGTPMRWGVPVENPGYFYRDHHARPIVPLCTHVHDLRVMETDAAHFPALLEHEWLAFAGLARLLVRADGFVSRDEMVALQEVFVPFRLALSEQFDTYRSAASGADEPGPAPQAWLDRAGAELPNEEAVRRAALLVTRPDAREAIYEALFHVAASDMIVRAEDRILEWLADAWGLGEGQG